MTATEFIYGLRYLLLKADTDSITDGVARAFAEQLLHVRVSESSTLEIEATNGDTFELSCVRVK